MHDDRDEVTGDEETRVTRPLPRRPRVLVLAGSFPPAYRAGGPPRTMENLVRLLGDRVDFKIITRNADLRSVEPLPEVEADRWVEHAGARVLYATPGTLTVRRWRTLLRATPHDLLYVNSLYAYRFSIIPLLLRRIGLVPRSPVVLAPRGQFSTGAFQVRGLRKRIFLRLTGALRLHHDVVWQASASHEAEDIRSAIGSEVDVQIVSNPFAPAPDEEEVRSPPKEPGVARVTYLGRIAENKNLSYALEILSSAEIDGCLSFDIHGPVDDPVYWDRCHSLLDGLPTNVKASYRGVLPHSSVGEMFAENHLLFLPTKGENFGHGILEALQHSCPVLISDRTPWRGLAEAGAGWNLPLEDRRGFESALGKVVAADASEHAEMRAAARRLALDFEKDSEVVSNHMQLFEGAIRGARG